MTTTSEHPLDRPDRSLDRLSEPDPDRVGAERREQRREDAPVLQGPERRDIQLGDPAGQREHPVPPVHPEGAELAAEL